MFDLTLIALIDDIFDTFIDTIEEYTPIILFAENEGCDSEINRNECVLPIFMK